MFKKFLMVMGAIFLALIVAALAVYIYFVIVGKGLDKESLAYSEDAMKAVATTWDKDALLARAHPNLVKDVSPEQMDKLFASLSTIGHMKEFQGCMGGSSLNYVPQQGFVATALYHCQAQFEKDKGVLSLSLVKENDAWKVGGMNMNSTFYQEKK